MSVKQSLEKMPTKRSKIFQVRFADMNGGNEKKRFVKLKPWVKKKDIVFFNYGKIVSLIVSVLFLFFKFNRS